MTKMDLRHYGDGELSLWFMNEEPLYRELRRVAAYGQQFWEIENYARELFEFTDEQLADLEQTFNAEVEEYERWENEEEENDDVL
jgi:hypothetical protein